MIHTAVRRLQFCAGHRVYKHESKCAHLHGHNYEALVHVAGQAGLDDLGRVVDFSVIKTLLGAWIENRWDHGFILYRHDLPAIDAVRSVSGKQKLYLLPDNPTAENLASYLVNEVGPQVFAGMPIYVNRVDLWETPNCMASACLEEPHVRR